jgi:hypothetical protein
MGSDLFFYALVLLGLLRLWGLLHYAWPSECPTGEQWSSTPATPPRKRSSDPKPFPGLISKPH